jgi:large subunit ribosomal protein L27
MASKKSGGSTSNNRDSNPKNLGLKKFGGELVEGGNILLRQMGNKYYPGNNVGQGKDFTLFAKCAGRVAFKKGHKERMFVSVLNKEVIN